MAKNYPSKKTKVQNKKVEEKKQEKKKEKHFKDPTKTIWAKFALLLLIAAMALLPLVLLIKIFIDIARA